MHCSPLSTGRAPTSVKLRRIDSCGFVTEWTPTALKMWNLSRRRTAAAGCNSRSEGGNAMSWEDREDNTIYKVVINHEEQYSIWPAHRENPLGWNDVGKSGPKQECLDYIKEVWTDMRPLSLRKKMEEMERERQASQEAN